MENKEKSFFCQIAQAKHPVIIIPEKSSTETLLAGMGIYHFIQNKENQKVTLAFRGRVPNRFGFLPGAEKIKHRLENVRQFVLSFNTEKNKISNVHYETLPDRVDIFITPQKGSIDPRDFFFALGQFKYDLVIILGAPSLEAVGECFTESADLFFEVPIINLDCDLENELYGQINLIDSKCSGVSELMANLFLKNKLAIPPVSADCFYAGLLEATKSFQSPRTTPNTLFTAARLIDNGADHQKVIRHLYKTENLTAIRFWGRLMARLKRLDNLEFSWTVAYQKDTEKNHYKAEEIKAIFTKIKNNCPKEENLMLLWESADQSTKGLFSGANADFFREKLKGIDWEEMVLFETPDPVGEAEIKIITQIKKLKDQSKDLTK